MEGIKKTKQWLKEKVGKVIKKDGCRQESEGRDPHSFFFSPLEPNTRKVQEKQLEKSLSFIFHGVETTRPPSIMYKYLCFFLETQTMRLKPRQKCFYPIKV